MKAPFGCLFLFALHAEQPGELRFFLIKKLLLPYPMGRQRIGKGVTGNGGVYHESGG
jgi:hypothetical protein